MNNDLITYDEQSLYSESCRIVDKIDWARHDHPKYVKQIAKYIPIARESKTLADLKKVSRKAKIPVKKLKLIGGIMVRDGKITLIRSNG